MQLDLVGKRYQQLLLFSELYMVWCSIGDPVVIIQDQQYPGKF